MFSIWVVLAVMAILPVVIYLSMLVKKHEIDYNSLLGAMVSGAVAMIALVCTIYGTGVYSQSQSTQKEAALVYSAAMHTLNQTTPYSEAAVKTLQQNNIVVDGANWNLITKVTFPSLLRTQPFVDEPDWQSQLETIQPKLSVTQYRLLQSFFTRYQWLDSSYPAQAPLDSISGSATASTSKKQMNIWWQTYILNMVQTNKQQTQLTSVLSSLKKLGKSYVKQ